MRYFIKVMNTIAPKNDLQREIQALVKRYDQRLIDNYPALLAQIKLDVKELQGRYPTCDPEQVVESGYNEANLPDPYVFVDKKWFIDIGKKTSIIVYKVNQG